MNQVGLVGRLTRDPELRYTQSGTAYCRFTMAVNRELSKEKREEAERNNQPTADFISCQAWGKTAEIISQYVKKGHLFGITGRIQTGRYEKDGRTIYTTDVMVRSFDFIQGKSKEESQGASGKAGGWQDRDDTGFYPIDDSDVPF